MFRDAYIIWYMKTHITILHWGIIPNKRLCFWIGLESCPYIPILLKYCSHQSCSSKTMYILGLFSPSLSYHQSPQPFQCQLLIPTDALTLKDWGVYEVLRSGRIYLEEYFKLKGHCQRISVYPYGASSIPIKGIWLLK